MSLPRLKDIKDYANKQAEIICDMRKSGQDYGRSAEYMDVFYELYKYEYWSYLLADYPSIDKIFWFNSIYNFAFMNAMDSFDYEKENKAAFISYMTTIFQRMIIDEMKRNATKVELASSSIEETFVSSDGEEYIDESILKDSNETPEQAFINKEYSEEATMMFVDAILVGKTKFAKQKHIENRQRNLIFFPSLFFSESLANMIINEGILNFAFVENNRQRLTEAANMEFMSTFLVNCCQTTTDIYSNEYRQLEEFNESAKDTERLCHDNAGLLFAIVFQKYYLKSTGKTLNDSVITKNRQTYRSLWPNVNGEACKQ